MSKIYSNGLCKKAWRVKACCKGDEVAFVVALWRGHVFRVMHDGNISKADDCERELFWR